MTAPGFDSPGYDFPNIDFHTFRVGDVTVKRTSIPVNWNGVANELVESRGFVVAKDAGSAINLFPGRALANEWKARDYQYMLKMEGILNTSIFEVVAHAVKIR